MRPCMPIPHPYSHVVPSALDILLEVGRTRHLADVEKLLRMLERGQAGIAQTAGVFSDAVDMVEDVHGVGGGDGWRAMLGYR